MELAQKLGVYAVYNTTSPWNDCAARVWSLLYAVCCLRNGARHN